MLLPSYVTNGFAMDGKDVVAFAAMRQADS